MKVFLKSVIGYLAPYKWYAVLNVFFNVLSSIFGVFSITMLMPFLSILFEKGELKIEQKPIELTIDSLQSNLSYFLSKIMHTTEKPKLLVGVCILIVIMIMFKTLSWYFANHFMTPLRNGIMRDLRNKIYTKIVSLPIGYFTETRKGDVISRMTGDVQEIEWSIMSSLEMTFREPVVIIISFVGLLVISAKLTLFVFVLFPVSAAVIGIIGKNLRKSSFRGQVKMGELISTIEETLSGLRIIKAFNAEKKVAENFSRQNNEFMRITNKIMRRRFLASPVSEFLGILVLVVVLWFGGKIVLAENGGMAAEALLVYLGIFSQIINPAKNFSQAYYNIQKGMASMDRVNSILNAEQTIPEKENPVRINEFKSTIEFRNVSFAYENEYVLKDINLTIEKGKIIALVGQSGSGKSTLVDLIPRFYDIQEGEILIDGIPIKDIKITDLRGLMGNVNQEPILFNESFQNNITFGVEGATLEDIISAAKVANANEFIVATEHGYDTNIGDRGSKLSGGQRQRVSIARAVLKNPPIMILDEATSALDTESEYLVQEALYNLMKNRTSIVIAHRLSTIRNADEICVLHEGRIVERGKHDDLLRIDGYYKKLYDMQAF